MCWKEIGPFAQYVLKNTCCTSHNISWMVYMEWAINEMENPHFNFQLLHLVSSSKICSINLCYLQLLNRWDEYGFGIPSSTYTIWMKMWITIWSGTCSKPWHRFGLVASTSQICPLWSLTSSQCWTNPFIIQCCLRIYNNIYYMLCQ